MRTLKRRPLWFVLALAAPVFLIVFLVRFQGQIERQKRDRAFIAAVKADNFEAAQNLLVSGANPNARDLPPDTRTLWQKFLNVLHPAPPEDRAAPSALSFVVGQYMYGYDSDPAREKHFILLKLLRDAGAAPEGDAPQFQSRWQALAKEIPDAPQAALPQGSRREAEEIRADLQACLSAIGVSAQVYGALARCYELYDARDYAVRAYRVALLWLPEDADLQTRFTELMAAPVAKQSLARTLPANTEILRVQIFQTVAGRREWAILFGKKQSDRQIYDLRAALYQEDGGKFTRVCQSPALMNLKNVNAVFDEADLFVVRATGRPLPEIVTRIVHEDPTWEPSHLDIWDINSRRFENILSLSSEARPSLEDLRHNGQYEACNEILVSCWPYDEMTEKWRRRDVYAFNGRRYVFADPDFPEQFTECIKTGEARLAETPEPETIDGEAQPETARDNADLLRHLAYLYQITGNPQKSEAYFRRAEALCRAALRSAIKRQDAPADIADTRKKLRHILARDAQTDY